MALAKSSVATALCPLAYRNDFHFGAAFDSMEYVIRLGARTAHPCLPDSCFRESGVLCAVSQSGYTCGLRADVEQLRHRAGVELSPRRLITALPRMWNLARSPLATQLSAPLTMTVCSCSMPSSAPLWRRSLKTAS